jgi:hypothetical protein
VKRVCKMAPVVNLRVPAAPRHPVIGRAARGRRGRVEFDERFSFPHCSEVVLRVPADIVGQDGLKGRSRPGVCTMRPLSELMCPIPWSELSRARFVAASSSAE